LIARFPGNRQNTGALPAHPQRLEPGQGEKQPEFIGCKRAQDRSVPKRLLFTSIGNRVIRIPVPGPAGREVRRVFRTPQEYTAILANLVRRPLLEIAKDNASVEVVKDENSFGLERFVNRSERSQHVLIRGHVTEASSSDQDRMCLLSQRESPHIGLNKMRAGIFPPGNRDHFPCDIEASVRISCRYEMLRQPPAAAAKLHDVFAPMLLKDCLKAAKVATVIENRIVHLVVDLSPFGVEFRQEQRPREKLQLLTSALVRYDDTLPICLRQSIA